MSACGRCERCGGYAPGSRRFCKECEKMVRSEMKESGYLQRVPQHSGLERTQEMRENTYETKHGTGHG